MGKVQQIDAAIRDTKQHIQESLEDVSQRQAKVRSYQEQRQQIVATKDFCESVLHQVKAALAMLHKVDPEQLPTFKNAIKAQFNLDPNKLTEEEYWQKVAEPQPDFKAIGKFKTIPLTTLNSPIFSEIPASPTTDQIFKSIRQCQLEVIREKFALAEIEIHTCYSNQKHEERWMVRWGEYEARLVWLADKGWSVKLCDGVYSREQAGMWYGFDLNHFLKEAGVDMSSWVQNPTPLTSSIPTTMPELQQPNRTVATFVDAVDQRHFEIIQEKFNLAGIGIIHCFMNRPEAKRWLIKLKGEEARLVWNEEEGWEVESMDEDNDGLTGQWLGFDLSVFLQENGVPTYTSGIPFGSYGIKIKDGQLN